MKTQHTTDVCFNCEASEGLHRYTTQQCPRNGIEETRYDKLAGKYYPQQWEDTTFEDAGIKKLQDAAPELLEILQRFMAYYESDFFKLSGKDGRTLAEWVQKANKAIKNATP